ncbi:hypothetical protein Slin15195_G028160 [Septoria linicola]|uniref:SigF-like NTF2-like domain-containing protein n=1 Tax=Septoria linicola TaxID=215465 RepID=A0A9Q9AP17_9PEZI|nr:hypothetical protein Slin14017_G027210 [Septoria linicola]USW49497.1 hypothetical protein Slin15195_G028160 [Septoria linicola]
MDDPIADIRDVVHRLTQGSPRQQEDTIKDVFTSDASFTHPFCRTGSFEGSRYLIWKIFIWYKLLSPSIRLVVNSVAYDEENMILYVNISQVFSIWFIPFHRSAVNLTTVLQLTHKPGSRKYYIKSQNDLYQVDQFFQFFAPWRIGTAIVLFWHFWATLFCVVLASLGKPFTRHMQARWQAKQNRRVSTNGVSSHDDARHMTAGEVKGVMDTGTTSGR